MTAVAAGAIVVQRRPFQEVSVVSLGHALTHWYPATFYLLLPLIGKELGLSYGQIGSILTCQFAAGAIANVPGEFLRRHCRPQRPAHGIRIVLGGRSLSGHGLLTRLLDDARLRDASGYREQYLASHRDPLAR